MPTAMIAPMNDSTFRVVPVSASIQRIPTSAPGTATRMMNGSIHDWKSTTSSKYTSAIASSSPRPSLPKAANIDSLWPRMWMRVALGSCPSESIAFWIATATPPRSRPAAEACTSTTRWTATWLIIETSLSGRSRATAPRYDAPAGASSPGRAEAVSTVRPSGIESSEGMESTLRRGVCTTTG